MLLSTLILAAEEHHENGAILPGDMNEVYWGSAAFFVLMALLAWKALPAAKNGLAARTERIRVELEEAEAARTAAAAELAGIRSQLSDADTERQRILAEAKSGATALEAELIARAETEVAAMRERAVADIEAAKSQALADVSATVSKLTVGAAEAVVRRSLDAGTQSELIDRYIEQVGAPA